MAETGYVLVGVQKLQFVGICAAKEVSVIKAAISIVYAEG